MVTNGVNKPFGSIEENGCSKFNHFTEHALTQFCKMGITHIWFTGIVRHSKCTSYEKYELHSDNPIMVKGVAGSPYAIKDYYDVDPDLAQDVNNRMQEFKNLVERCHNVGLKVIIDFIPNHVSRQYDSQNTPKGSVPLGKNDDKNVNFSPNNNFYYIPNTELKIPEGLDFQYIDNSQPYIEYPAKATGNNVFNNNPTLYDWYETIKLNYGVDYNYGEKKYFDRIPATWQQMYEILMFWADMNIDGFRADMAEMVPLEFWKWVIQKVKNKFNHIVFIAEIYNTALYKSFIFEGGFDYLYDKEEFYNYTRTIISGLASSTLLTQCWQQQEGLSQYMLRFLENHDEQRIASKFFTDNAFFSFPAIIVAATMHKGPFMIYFGQEIGETAADSEGFSGVDGRTTIFDYWKVTEYQNWVDNGNFTVDALTPTQQRIRDFYLKILQLRLKYCNILEGAFYDLMWINKNNLNSDKIYAFLRFNNKNALLVIVNFDLSSGQSFVLNINQHVFDFMKISMHTVIRFTDVFLQNCKFEKTTSDVINSGINLSLARHAGKIFELSW